MAMSSTHYDYFTFKRKFEEVFTKYKDKTAIVNLYDNGTKTENTYENIFDGAKRLMETFRELGIEQHERVAVLSKHTPYVAALLLQLSYIGVTSVLLDATLPNVELEHLIKFSDVSAIMIAKDCFDKIDMALFFDISILEICDCENEYKIINAPEKKAIDTPTDNEVIAIIFSSGTTGEMKGVMVTYSSIYYSLELYAKLFNLTSEMSYLHTLPFNHVAGMSNIFHFVLNGCQIGMLHIFSPINIQNAVLIYNPSLFGMVPKFFEMLEQKVKQNIRQTNILFNIYFNIMLRFSGVMRKYFGINIGKRIFCQIIKKIFGNNIFGIGTGSSYCKKSTVEFFLNLGLEWANFYASTEIMVPAVTAVTIGSYDKYPNDTVGNINRFEEIIIKIHNPDENRIGEVLIKSPLIMKGYFKKTELTKSVFIDGYFKTGDYGYIDSKGNLHITGRLKESIVLKNGKKVAPVDVDEYYSLRTGDLELDLASRGITNDEGYDEIHIFVEDKNYSVSDKIDIKGKLANISVSAPSIYKVRDIHFIDQIPKTSVGKVKRFCLNTDNEIKFGEVAVQPENNGNKLISLIQKYTDIKEILLESDLKYDLGLDSLGMFELMCEVEAEYNINLSGIFANIHTVNDLRNNIFNHSKRIIKSTENFDISKFPMRKSDEDIKMLKKLMAFSRKIWNFDIAGIENIPKDKNYILCPNHESHLDGLWVFSAISDTLNFQQICCMAKKEHLQSFFTRKWLKLLGGIPVDRYVNPLESIKRCIECVNQGNILLIHPEGTRTRDGKLGDFKDGAAKIAIDTNCPIVPVCIGGAREIYPAQKKLPKIFDILNMKKYKIEISFGPIIDPAGKTQNEITEEIRFFVSETKGKNRKE